MPERIDRKYNINARSTTRKKSLHTEHDSILFLAKDEAVPAMLKAYKRECIKRGSDQRQILGINLLIARVNKYQKENPRKVKVADISRGKEERLVNAPND